MIKFIKRFLYKWNPIYNILMKMKDDYRKKFKNIDTYDINSWIEKLDKEEYNNFFSCLQTQQENEILLIRYGLAEMQRGMWEDKNSPYRECRSIVIDLKNEAIILTPFRKFFNFGEVEENSFENIQKKLKTAKIVEYTDKLDGSMQSARKYRGSIFMAGSQSINSNNSWRLADGYLMLTQNYKKMINKNWWNTFIFEYISLKDAHVVKYEAKDEGLYLIGIRNVFTGKEKHYFEIEKVAKRYGVKVTKIEKTTLEEILEKSKELKSENKEGWILNIDGHRLKFKCDDYVDLHRMLDFVSSINVIIKCIADNTYDDLISKIPDAYKNRVECIANEVFKYVNTTKNEIKKYYELAPKENKKDFMIWIDKNCKKDIKNYVRMEYLGQEYHLLKTIRGETTSYKKLSDMGIKLEKQYSALYTEEGEN